MPGLQSQDSPTGPVPGWRLTATPSSRHLCGMLDGIWATMVLLAIVWACLTGRTEALGAAVFDGANSAIELVVGLVGAMAFFLGLMKIAFDGGLRDAIARGIAPLLGRLFPEVPAKHPAMAAMVMNLASNVAGLGNAATPFGLKAMEELRNLSKSSNTASDAMVLFVVINASAVTLLPPLGTMAVRAAAGSTAPGSIWLPTLLATTCSTVAAVVAHFALRDRPPFRLAPPKTSEHAAAGEEIGNAAEQARNTLPLLDVTGSTEAAVRVHPLARLGTVAVLLALVFALIKSFFGGEGNIGAVAQSLLVPGIIAALVLTGLRGGVPVYEAFIEGARDGLEVALRIIPYLVAMLVAIAMLRASGAIDSAVAFLGPFTAPFGVPAEVLPMALLRPLSGSGSFAVMAETIKEHGPDSFIGLLASTLQGSTETTFYVLAVYFGAAGVRNVRHALYCGLIADVAGFVGAVVACHLFFDVGP